MRRLVGHDSICTEESGPYDSCNWKCYLPEIHQIKKPNFLVQIQMKPKSRFECVVQDTEISEMLDSVDLGDAAILVEIVI